MALQHCKWFLVVYISIYRYIKKINDLKEGNILNESLEPYINKLKYLI